MALNAQTLESGVAYNERLFSGGLRKFLHTARFRWLQRCVARLNCSYDSVLEIGGYDGRSLEFLPALPKRYVGYEADYEDALALARAKWKDYPNYDIRESFAPDDMQIDDERFDVALALETLEHINPDDLDAYLEKIAGALKPEGYFFVSVPVEIGPVFAVKQVIKMLFVGDPDPYSFKEYMCSSLGLVQFVERGEHKGFSYFNLRKALGVHFSIEKSGGIPFTWLPGLFNFGVTYICRPKSV